MLIIALFMTLAGTACENIGKRTVFSALQQQSKYDCELADNEVCPRSPENYDVYNWQREQKLKEE
jgi:hypothetical protein